MTETATVLVAPPRRKKNKCAVSQMTSPVDKLEISNDELYSIKVKPPRPVAPPRPSLPPRPTLPPRPQVMLRSHTLPPKLPPPRSTSATNLQSRPLAIRKFQALLSTPPKADMLTVEMQKKLQSAMKTTKTVFTNMKHLVKELTVERDQEEITTDGCCEEDQPVLANEYFTSPIGCVDEIGINFNEMNDDDDDNEIYSTVGDIIEAKCDKVTVIIPNDYQVKPKLQEHEELEKHEELQKHEGDDDDLYVDMCFGTNSSK